MSNDLVLQFDMLSYTLTLPPTSALRTINELLDEGVRATSSDLLKSRKALVETLHLIDRLRDD